MVPDLARAELDRTTPEVAAPSSDRPYCLVMTWFRRRTERRLARARGVPPGAELIDEDVTVFGEQLTDLHVEMLTTEPDRDMRLDYQRSLDLYDEAKATLSTASAAQDGRGARRRS